VSATEIIFIEILVHDHAKCCHDIPLKNYCNYSLCWICYIISHCVATKGKSRQADGNVSQTF